MVVPLCRCRVLYIGTAVPIVTKDGLQGIQQPLRERYPVEDTPETRGIDTWLSVWSNGVLIEYVEGEKKSETAFFPINTLHYCAAVRYVNVTGFSVEGGGERFLPLDSPFANIPNSPHPPIFAAIFRRTTGVKVLECHGFICTNSKAANALVRCCFHAYADSIYLQLDEKIPGLKAIKGKDGEEESREKELSLEASPRSDRQLSEGETNDPPREEMRRNHWEWRQQAGDYETASISSSLGDKKGPRKTASENGRHGTLVPFHEGRRRFGSEADLPLTDDEEERVRGRHVGEGGPLMPPPFFMPPPPHLLPPGVPPGMIMFPPPPHLLPPHSRHPHHPPMPPPPFFGRLPPGMPFPPPPPMGAFPPPFPPRSFPQADNGPIVTGPESVYGGTLRGRAFDNSYNTHQTSRTSLNGGDTMRRERGDEGDDRSSSVWNKFEEGIYRKPHLNEKAFSNTLSMESRTKDGDYDTLRSTTIRTVETEIIRPDSPPVDYDAVDGARKRANGNARRETSAC